MERRADWNHYVYVYGEGEAAREARVEFDVMAAVMPGDDGVTLRVVAPEAQEAAVSEVLQPLEGLWVGTMRYAGQVETVVQCPRGSLDPAIGSALEALGASWQQVDGWAYTNDRIAPTPADWRRIEDREALERLDLDGDGELRVLHRFYGSAAGLKAIEERLADERFTRVDGSDERLTLAHSHPIGAISEITCGLLRLGEAHGVAYDGWVLPG